MYNKIAIFFLVIFFSLLGSTAIRAQNTFEKEVDFGGFAHGNAVIQTSDNGYLVGGYKYGTDSTDTSNFFPCIAKFDLDGNIQWAKFIETSDIGEVTQLALSSDNNFYIAGLISGQGQGNAFILKCDRDGNILWTRLFFNNSSSTLLSESDFGDCMLVGTSLLGLPFIMRVGSDGTVLWAENIGFNNRESNISSITRLSGNNYLLVGSTNAPSGAITLTEIESSSGIGWAQILAATSDIFCFSSCKTADGGFAICGVVEISTENKDIFVAKFDASGSLSWGKEIDQFSLEEGLSIVEADNGDLFVTCFGGPTGVIFLRLANTGEVKSLKSLLGTSNFEAVSIIKSDDGGFVFTGSRGHYINNKSGGILLGKIDSNMNGCHLQDQLFIDLPFGKVIGGRADYSSAESLTVFDMGNGKEIDSKEIDLCSLSSVSELPTTDKNFFVFPNPLRAGKTLSIHMNENLPAGSYEIRLYDVLGILMKTEKINRNDIKEDIIFETPSCPAGTYLLELRSPEKDNPIFRTNLIIE